MLAQDLRSKLKDDQVVFGGFSPYRDPQITEFLARAGFDFIIFDAEHGAVTEADMPALSMACEAHGCAPIVRIASEMPRETGRFLDFGAQGIMAPMVNAVADAKRLVTSMRYPPLGTRGFAPTRALSGKLSAANALEHIERANFDLIAIAQIETREAVQNLSDILAAEDIDIVFIGPADLSVSLGIPMQFDNPEFIACVVKISQIAREHSCFIGAAISTPEDAALMHKLGVRFFAGYLETIATEMWRGFIADARGQCLGE